MHPERLMQEKRFPGGRIRPATYDARDRRLELEFAGATPRIYRAVPAPVWEKLCASPNPASFWEDRIAEEYPETKGSAASRPDARARLDALFSAQKPTPESEREP